MSSALAISQEQEPNLVKRISIETERLLPFEGIPGARFGGITSRIILSQPLPDFNKGQNNKLLVATVMYRRPENTPYWGIKVDDEKGYVLDSGYFGRLDEAISSYSESRLDRWYQSAIDSHKAVVDQIENLYWGEGSIHQHFIEQLRLK